MLVEGGARGGEARGGLAEELRPGRAGGVGALGHALLGEAFVGLGAAEQERRGHAAAEQRCGGGEQVQRVVVTAGVQRPVGRGGEVRSRCIAAAVGRAGLLGERGDGGAPRGERLRRRVAEGGDAGGAEPGLQRLPAAGEAGDRLRVQAGGAGERLLFLGREADAVGLADSGGLGLGDGGEAEQRVAREGVGLGQRTLRLAVEPAGEREVAEAAVGVGEQQRQLGLGVGAGSSSGTQLHHLAAEEVGRAGVGAGGEHPAGAGGGEPATLLGAVGRVSQRRDPLAVALQQRGEHGVLRLLGGGARGVLPTADHLLQDPEPLPAGVGAHVLHRGERVVGAAEVDERERPPAEAAGVELAAEVLGLAVLLQHQPVVQRAGLAVGRPAAGLLQVDAVAGVLPIPAALLVGHRLVGEGVEDPFQLLARLGDLFDPRRDQQPVGVVEHGVEVRLHRHRPDRPEADGKEPEAEQEHGHLPELRPGDRWIRPGFRGRLRVIDWNGLVGHGSTRGSVRGWLSARRRVGLQPADREPNRPKPPTVRGMGWRLFRETLRLSTEGTEARRHGAGRRQKTGGGAFAFARRATRGPLGRCGFEPRTVAWND